MMGTKIRSFSPLSDDLSLEELVPDDHFYRRKADLFLSKTDSDASPMKRKGADHSHLGYQRPTACSTVARRASSSVSWSPPSRSPRTSPCRTCSGDPPSSAANERGRALLAELGLAEMLDFLPEKLSGGEKQRVAIDRALVNDPSLILADEPIANLDSKIGHEIMRLLRRIAKEQERSVIIVSHDARIKDIADQGPVARVRTVQGHGGHGGRPGVRHGGEAGEGR